MITITRTDITTYSFSEKLAFLVVDVIDGLHDILDMLDAEAKVKQQLRDMGLVKEYDNVYVEIVEVRPIIGKRIRGLEIVVVAYKSDLHRDTKLGLFTVQVVTDNVLDNVDYNIFYSGVSGEDGSGQ